MNWSRRGQLYGTGNLKLCANRLPPTPVVNVISSHCPSDMSGCIVNTANINGMLSRIATRR